MAAAEAEPILTIQYPGELRSLDGRRSDSLCGFPTKFELRRVDFQIYLPGERFILARSVPAEVCIDPAYEETPLFDCGILSTVYRQAGVQLSRLGNIADAAFVKNRALWHEMVAGDANHGRKTFSGDTFQVVNSRR